MAKKFVSGEKILHEEQRVLRQPLVNRIVHWGVALSIFVLFVSGFGQMPIFKRYGIADLPGMAWMANYGITLGLHYIATVVLLVVGTFHLAYHGLRRDLGLLPRRGDVGDSARIVGAMLFRRPEPPSHKYLAEQRLAYAFIAANVIALVLTGFVKVADNLPAFSFSGEVTFVATMGHNLAMLMLFLGIAGHLVAFVFPANRKLIAGIFHGKVDLAYVTHRHRLWHAELGARDNAAEPVLELEPELAVPSPNSTEERTLVQVGGEAQ